jgi:hypothetical protein
MEVKPNSHEMIKRLIPTVAVWAVGRMLATPQVKGALSKVDARAHRNLKRVRRNASDNAAWLAAGVAAIAVGIGLMAKAARKK